MTFFLINLCLVRSLVGLLRIKFKCSLTQYVGLILCAERFRATLSLFCILWQSYPKKIVVSIVQNS